MIFNGPSKEFLQLQSIHCNNCYEQPEELESPLTLLWFEQDGQSIRVDDVNLITQKNQVICLTEFHKVDISTVCNAKMIRFNRSFYCVLDHDSEVGCKGILFFGASQIPTFEIPSEELEKFQTIWKMFELELASPDELQLEMLQSMLKRFIILCTRIFKAQNNYSKLENGKSDVVREYNFLVEQHFKSKHHVSDYAEMMNKSPKTLSNLFSKLSDKTPLQFIQARKILEARRLLRHSNLSIKEIGFEIGFEDVQTFSRFFKKMEGQSPTEYKELSR